jgi:hypothetical protein
MSKKLPKEQTHLDKAAMAKKYGKPLTMSVPEAGWIYYGLGRMGSYKAAHRGDLEVMEVGGTMRVLTAAMDAKMERKTETALQKMTEDNPSLLIEK